MEKPLVKGVPLWHHWGVNETQVEKIAKALADKSRVKILREILRKETMPCMQAEKCTDLAQPTVSHHVKILIDAGLVVAKKEGRKRSLSINKTELKKFENFLASLG